MIMPSFAMACESSWTPTRKSPLTAKPRTRSEEHTSELQSRLHLVCRLLLEKHRTSVIRTGRVSAHASHRVPVRGTVHDGSRSGLVLEYLCVPLVRPQLHPGARARCSVPIDS